MERWVLPGPLAHAWIQVQPLDDDELVAYILTGLDDDFNPFVSSLITKTEPISVSELYA
jgi:hypothetical protein